MGIPEPSSPLWTAVKGIHDPWPPDDEIVAGGVGALWRRGGEVVAQGGNDTTAAGGAVVAAWRDQTGTDFHGKVAGYSQTVDQVRQRMQTLVAHCEHYSRELASAKSTITTTIAANEDTYALLGNPMLGAVAPALQGVFATAVANQLRGMIEEKANALRANPVGAQLPAPPPPDESSPLDAFFGGAQDVVAGGLRRWGELDQLVWRNLGDQGDNLIDGLGDRAGDLLRGLGTLTGSQDLVRTGDDVQASMDTNGDRFAEELTGAGADNRSDIFDAATAIDGDKEPVTVYLSRERYPESAAHIDDAQSGTSYLGHADTAYPRTQETELTVDRDGAKRNRADSLRGVPPESGYDRDEYPPAMFEEGGKGASVQYITPSDNRGAGASMGSQLRHYSAEDSVDRQTRRVGEGETVIIETYG